MSDKWCELAWNPITACLGDKLKNKYSMVNFYTDVHTVKKMLLRHRETLKADVEQLSKELGKHLENAENCYEKLRDLALKSNALMTSVENTTEQKAVATMKTEPPCE